MARQRLGQHFLGDPEWRETIAREIRVSPHGMHANPGHSSPDYCWVEIGAGHGEMTEHLLKSGAPVIAVELDPPLVRSLQRMANTNPSLTVIHGDILEIDLAAIASGRRIRIYGNLPYYITSPILHRFFQYAGQIDEAHILIQLEVAERLTAEPNTKDYGYLSVVTQFYCRPEFVLRIPPGAFQPPPEVDSALVTLRFPGQAAKWQPAELEKFLKFVKACFAQKRKTLPNNLRSLIPPEQARENLRKLQIREDARAEQLNEAQFVTLYRAISSGLKAGDQGSHS